MRGRSYLKKRHYCFPISENAERRKLLNIGETNPTLMWIKLRGLRNASCIEGELYAWIRSADMYNDMVAVCKKNGFTPDTQKRFSLELHKYGWGTTTSKKRSGDGIHYRVYGMNQDAFREIPDIVDMDISTGDVFEKEAGYDPGDIN
jgi:hypothetical protein